MPPDPDISPLTEIQQIEYRRAFVEWIRTLPDLHAYSFRQLEDMFIHQLDLNDRDAYLARLAIRDQIDLWTQDNDAA